MSSFFKLLSASGLALVLAAPLPAQHASPLPGAGLDGYDLLLAQESVQRQMPKDVVLGRMTVVLPPVIKIDDKDDRLSPGARNVPVVFFDEAAGKPVPNPDFLAVVEQNLPRTTKLVIGCQAGGRSQHACEILAAAGYRDVANVRGGFGGARDQSGRVVVPGWRDAGLPVEEGQTPGASYGDLRKRTGPT